MLRNFLFGVLLMTLTTSSAFAKDDADAGGSMSVEIVGVVQTGVMAIGGESTGSTVSALGFTWELDFKGNKEFLALAEKSNGKELVVKGQVTVRQGVERGRRVIVIVRDLKVLTK